jgi:branched-chain amino acid transport system permease protein
MLGTVLQAAVSGLLIGGVYALISMGLALIFGVVNVVNFAHGEFLMVGMYLTYWAFMLWNVDPHLSILSCTVVLFFLGYITQKLLIERTFNKPFEGEIQIFVTIGFSLVLVHGIQMLWQADYRGIELSYSGMAINVGGLSLNFLKIVSFIVTLAVAFFLYLFLTKTDSGRAMRAITENREAATLLGIDVPKHYCLAFGIGAGLTGIAGALLTPIFYIHPGVGLIFVLKAFVITVLGGMGSVSGAFVAALIIGVVETVGGVFIGGAYTQALIFLIFILTMLFKPTGLFGKKI